MFVMSVCDLVLNDLFELELTNAKSVNCFEIHNF